MRPLKPLHFAAELAQLAARDKPITIGLAGAGQMGTDIVVQVAGMPGLRIGAICETRAGQGAAAAALAGYDASRIITANTGAHIDAAIERGGIAVTEDISAITAAGRIDVVIDATGNPNSGATFALDAIANGKHIVMLNVEADITIGRTLKAAADKAGVIYTGAAGDEPAATLEILGFAQSLGLEIIAAGKGKNNPLKFDAIPAEYVDEARQRNMNPRMLVEFVDGTKTMVEMVAVANATGLTPDKPGMHGPAATLDTLASVLCPREDGGVLSRRGVVDYSIGKGVAPGVFVIVGTRHPRILERLIDLKVGPGPYFTLHRPYHLTSLEVPLTAARAVLHRRADMVPLDRPVAEAVALAKRDLAPGETLGRIGELDYRGWAMTYSDARDMGALPIGLAEKAKVTRAVKKGEVLTYAACTPDAGMRITQLRRQQDQDDARFA
jgi:predicted homoserine dehydrogenase-like protein